MGSLVSGFLQDLVKICIKYIEANNFLLLNYITRRQCIVFLSSLVVLFGGNLCEWGQLFSREILWWGGGGQFFRAKFPRGQMPGGDFSSRVIVRGAIVRG